MKPIFEGAPGHIVRRAGNKWEVRWQARTDLVAKGFTPKSERIWIGGAPTDMERSHVADRCRRLQDEMLLYSRGGLPTPTISHVFDGTLRSLISCYQTDPDSRYHKKQYAAAPIGMTGAAKAVGCSGNTSKSQQSSSARTSTVARSHKQSAQPMQTRFINCEVCQTEGRILRNSGGPDDVDYGVCPACDGKREVEVECEPITIFDLENAEWY